VFWTNAIICVLIFAGTGFGVLALGLRGRRLDSVPVCRRCKFDVSGTLDRPRCPECGADLSRHRSIQIGRRRVRPWVSAAGVVLVACSLLPFNPFAPRVTLGMVGIIPDHWKWTSCLLAESRSADGRVVSAALSELVRRIDRGALSSVALRTLASQGLEYRDRPSPSNTWNPEYAWIIEAAWRKELLTASQIKEYCENGLQVSWQMSERKSFGAERIFEVFVERYYREDLQARLRTTLESLTVSGDGVELEPAGEGEEGNRSRRYFLIRGEALVISWRISISDTATGKPIGTTWVGQATVPVQGLMAGGVRRDGQGMFPNPMPR
jgi:hypothetical protein